MKCEYSQHNDINNNMFNELFDSPAEPVCIAAGLSPRNYNFRELYLLIGALSNKKLPICTYRLVRELEY